MRIAVVTLALLSFAAAADAVTINVPGDQPTIAAGLAAAANGDTVLLASGTYLEYNLDLPAGVTLRGEPGGMDNVTIDARGLGRCVNALAGEGGLLYNLHLIGGDASYGGAVFVYGSLGITNCHFEDNSAFDKGGAVYQGPGTSVDYMGCQFTGNTVRSTLGDDQGQGGAIFANGATFSMSVCTYSNNTAVTQGGAIHIKTGVSSMSFCTFDGNSTQHYGGAIACDNASPPIGNCNFAGNVSRFGGAIYCANGGSPTVTGGTFSANEARLMDYGYGGAIYIEHASSPTIISATFVNNIANYGGGVYCNGTGSTTIMGSEFRDNLTPASHPENWLGGAGLAIDENADATVTNCLFRGQSCPYEGGAVANWSNQNPRFENCVFHDNEAGWGGGFYGEWSSIATLANCTFTYNSATEDGGAICTWHTASLNCVCCIVAYTRANGAVHEEPGSSMEFNCSNIWNNTGGDWADGIEDQAGGDYNASVDPQFCGTDALDGNVHLQSDSPCALANSPCGLLIGARDVGCATTATEAATWSSIKAMY